MSENEKKVPKRRFKEFENAEAWEHQKLKQLANFAKGQGYSKNDLIDVGTPIILYGRLYTKYQSTISEVDTFAVPKSGSVYSTGEEVIVPASGETAEDIARASAVVKSGFLLGGDLNIIYPNKDISTVFLALSISNGKQQKELSKRAQGKSVVHLHNSDLEDVTISFPCRDEQERIGSVFEHLDNLITLHQCKLEKIKALKKAYLTEMFPAEGERKPKLRFAGFTDDWEQRDVTEIGKIYIGLVTTMTKHYTDCGTLLIRNSDIKDNRFEFGDSPIYLEKSFAEANSSRKHQIGDVITVHTGDVGTSAVITEEEENTIGFATIVTRPNKQIMDSYYFSTFLNTDKHKKWAVSISTGDGRTNYNLGDYFKLVVPVPSLEEQKKIADFIERLNNLITLHQRKLEKLQNIKKAHLNEMFI